MKYIRCVNNSRKDITFNKTIILRRTSQNETYNYIYRISGFNSYLQSRKSRKCVRSWRTYFLRK